MPHNRSAELGNNKDFVVRSNDHDRSPLDCETWEEADRLSAKLNAETDQDTKFWVEAKA